MHVRRRRRGSMEEFEVKKEGMLTTGEWCDPVRKMKKRMSGDRRDWARDVEEVEMGMD